MADPILRPVRLGPHMVPGLWRWLLPEKLFSLAIPAESRATCASCPRIESDGFRPDYRCCTYVPRVPNFLLGLALEAPGGPERLARPEAHRLLLPEGLQASPQGWANFLEDAGQDRFGKSERVLCPLLLKESGLCGIYAFRNGVCSTYFCYYDDGARGENFWEALQTCVTQVEMALGQWALTKAGFDVPAYVARLNELAPRAGQCSDARGWSEMARRHVWGEAYGRELEVFAACAAAVRGNLPDLWKIANGITILEADAFEMACQKLVGEEHQDQIEDDFSDPDRETVKPKELWRTVLRRHRKMQDGKSAAP